MANKGYTADVLRVTATDTGVIKVYLHSANNLWPGNRWWMVPNGTPGSSAMLAVSLTAMASGLRVEIYVDEALNENDELHYISALRGI